MTGVAGMADQEFLATALRARMDRAGGAPPDDDDACTAVAVLSRFDPAGFAASALAFATGLAATDGEPWLRSYTRTVFLAGNPHNLRRRFRFHTTAADGTLAWCGPGPAAAFTPLRRLLKAFPAGPLRVRTEVVVGEAAAAAGAAAPHRLFLATAGLTIAGYLVHVNHSIAEAVLTGTLPPGARLVLCCVPDLDEAILRSAVAVRVHRDQADPQRLRAYTCLVPPAE